MMEMEQSHEFFFPERVLGNYSKKTEKKPRFRPVKMSEMKTLNLCENTAEKKELHAVISKDRNGGWQWITGVMDSGASESVAHPYIAHAYPVTATDASRAGASYTSASGNDIPNLGEQVLNVVANDGRSGQVKYQSADVTKALNSVSEICDAGGDDGQIVMFNKWGGHIWNPSTGRKVPRQRKNSIYILGMWVRPNANVASFFPRPGQ